MKLKYKHLTHYTIIDPFTLHIRLFERGGVVTAIVVGEKIAMAVVVAKKGG
jgi:hypothetical protein